MSNGDSEEICAILLFGNPKPQPETIPPKELGRNFSNPIYGPGLLNPNAAKALKLLTLNPKAPKALKLLNPQTLKPINLETPYSGSI